MRLAFFQILFFLFSGFTNLLAQERCAQVPYEEMRHSSLQKNKDAFEQWMKSKIASRKNQNGSRTQSGPYIIPVVVHVINNGELIGTGTNISDVQIQSQIKVLNNDYKRLNADASNTPAEFQSLAGSMDIQFKLAQQDPNGFATNGILRVKGSKSGWAYADGPTVKALSYWRSDWYLNLWVVNETDQYAGYAQLPVPDGTSLAGLEDSPRNALTDGVVIDYTAFGSNDDGNFKLDAAFNKGRTATHEIGHFFGLRHIWGDNSNCATDYVSDTPPQDSNTTSCPSNPQTSCNGHKMFQNYMDYTDDRCMNIFTKGQIERMDVVINNSPRRNSLLSSPGTLPPAGSDPVYNLELTAINSPSPVICIQNPQPIVRIRNNGNITISNFKVDITINNGTTISTTIADQVLLQGGEKEIKLLPLSLNEGVNTIVFTLKEPNGHVDKIPSDNSITLTSVVSKASNIIPLRQNFNTSFADWTIVSQNNELKWTTISTNYSTSLVYNAFNNSNLNQKSWLVSPVLDLSALSKASLLFDVSYAIRSTGVEELQLLSSTDCGVTFSEVQYDRYGDDLSFVNSATSWVPSHESDWLRDFVNLNDLAGQQKVRLAFVITNQNGNNLYLDNLEFYEDDTSTPAKVSVPYYIYASSSGQTDYKITFNLTDRSDVQVYVYNLLGQKMAEHHLPNTLNQTYPLDFADSNSGIYIIKTQIENKISSSKIFVAK